jgi:site-specific DNA recombinase
MNATKAIAYCRVSTAEQAREGLSLRTQEDMLRAYAASKGLELVAVIVEEGVSGSKRLASRPAGREMLLALEAGEAGHVLAVRLDRLFRKAADCLTQVDAWEAQGTTLHLLDFAGGALDTHSPLGRCFLTIVAALGELERNTIVVRAREIAEGKRQRGEALSRPARGLRIEGKHLVPDADALGMIRRARQLRAQGLTLATIAQRLTDEGYRPQRRGAGRAIAHQTVSYMLRNGNLQSVA